jgi:glycerophosphoryl diester phosphodiesterase
VVVVRLCNGQVATIIGHRGAPGYRPEHTRTSYLLAIAMGVDAVEPDLVMTRDGVVVVRHECDLSTTTDIARHRGLAGRPVEDLTLAELRTLRAVERIPGTRPRNTRWDGAEEVITLDELLLLVSSEARRLGRRIGLHLELKDATRLAGLGLDLEGAVLESLRDHGLDRRESGVHLQSFEPTCLHRLRERTDLRLVQLVEAAGAPVDLAAAGDPTTYDDLASPRGLRMVASYADAVGLAKARLLGRPDLAEALVDQAHLSGLQVLAWTLREENRFLSPRFRRGQTPGRRGDAAAELAALLDAGVDGVFCDHPDLALAARDAWRPARVVG